MGREFRCIWIETRVRWHFFAPPPFKYLIIIFYYQFYFYSFLCIMEDANFIAKFTIFPLILSLDFFKNIFLFHLDVAIYSHSSSVIVVCTFLTLYYIKYRTLFLLLDQKKKKNMYLIYVSYIWKQIKVKDIKLKFKDKTITLIVTLLCLKEIIIISYHFIYYHPK